MNARGIAAGLFFSWGNEGYQEYETFGQYERYMRYLVARYASKNVFWILVGELEEAGEPRSRWRDYASVVSRSDPYGHPISLHTVATTDSFGPDADHSFVSQQRFGSPEELRRLVSESRIYQKPVVNLEYGYEGDPAVFGNNQFPDEVRKDHYALALAGGYGVYGNHTPWYSTYHRVGDFVLGATDTPGAEYLRILFDFFSGTSFHRLRPAQELTSRGIAAAWDGQEYVIQLPMGGDVEVDLTNALQTYRAVWFDPRTGGRASLATVDGGGRRSFTAPDGRDWILHLQADGLGGPDSVQIDLGEDIEAGILHPSAGDGNTSVASISGRLARTNTDPPSDRYFYFSVSDAFAFEGNRADVFITVDYFDGSSGSLSLQYDSSEGAFKAADSVVLTGAQTWKSHTFHVTDAFFGNRQNSGADFRFFGAVGQTSYLDVVRVTTTGTGPPAPATNPLPDDGAAEIEPEGLRLSWNPGSGASAHDVYFATTSPLPFEGRQTSIGFEPGTSLSRGTTYLWRIDEVNVEGVTTGNVWSFVTAMTAPLVVPTLEAKEAQGMLVDGDPSDWNLKDFTATVPAGEILKGDHALVGYDEDGLHVAGYATRLVLPASASDHTVRAYAQHDSSSLFFLFRLEDDDVRTPFDQSMNWANDAVEIYLDPGSDRGAAPMDASTSDVQIVIDAANEKNVYVTTSAYRDRVLAGITSAVSVDGTGWWLEVGIAKDALQPTVPMEGRIGVDFNFRDNDSDNDPSLSTVYTWSDSERSSRFPSKIPNRWGELVLPTPGAPTLPEPTSGPMPTDRADGVGASARLSWARAAGASHYDVHFGTSRPPPFAVRSPQNAFEPGELEPDTTYFWRVDSENGAGTTAGPVWQFTTSADVTAPALEIARTGPLNIDGNIDDWELTGLETVVRAGDAVAGEVALVGFDNGTLYWAGRATRLGLPVSGSDHSARVHARHDDDFLYVLVRLDDDDVRFEHGPAMNWANDSVELYFDPSSDRGAAPMSDSTSDVQLVVDAKNQVNVYVTTDAYRNQILAGIVSAVSQDSAGWWLELRIAKSALDPNLPASGSIGLDFNFRDNDGGNAPALSSVYSWSDTEESGSFPSKIPNRWGTGRLR